jgi:hypothetical protein
VVCDRPTVMTQLIVVVVAKNFFGSQVKSQMGLQPTEAMIPLIEIVPKKLIEITYGNPLYHPFKQKDTLVEGSTTSSGSPPSTLMGSRRLHRAAPTE